MLRVRVLGDLKRSIMHWSPLLQLKPFLSSQAETAEAEQPFEK